MIRRPILAAFIAVLAAACRPTAPDSAGATTRARADSAIYGMLLDSLRGTGDSVLVHRNFDEFPDSVAAAPELAA